MQQVLSVLSNINVIALIISFIVIFIVFYGLISLLTWNLLKPLKYLGIPTLVVGIIILITRFTSSFIINSLASEFGSFIKDLFPLAFSPLQNIGIIFFILGLLMIIIYAVINNNKNKIDNNEKNVQEEF